MRGLPLRRSERPNRRPHAARRQLLLAGLLLGACTVAARAFQVTVINGASWGRRADAQHTKMTVLPAARGTIYDRDGVPLAASRPRYIVSIAPREIPPESRDVVIATLHDRLKLSGREARDVVASKRSWIQLSGRFEESLREELGSVPGVHFEQAMQRFYPHGELASELIGRVNATDAALGGIELELDSLLRGRAGSATVRRDSRGQPIPGAMVRTAEPVPGFDAVLTIDYELQEIANDALRLALAEDGAEGGEILLVDPHTGEVLAAASRSAEGHRSNWTAATVPYEPGSTIKAFTLSAVLGEGRGSLRDSIWAEDGRYPLNGRVITDSHAHGWLTLREGFLVSSNIVMAKVASRLEPSEQYRYLRDFGFGSPTGVAYPAESGGRLGRPDRWSRQSQASLAMGYEIAVTPLQLAMAYAAIANGGTLLEPRVIREIRAHDGRVIRSFPSRSVRRTIPSSIAREVRTVLTEAVESGTGKEAALGDYKVAGKTGTARIAENGRYIDHEYIATFAGFFPAEDPQLVFIVKLDRPQGDYYASQTAAPVTRRTLEAALAARGTPLDRGAIARRPSPMPLRPGSVPVALDGGAILRAARQVVRLDRESPADRIVVVALDRTGHDVTPEAPGSIVVPAVSGLPLRDAVRALHAAGVRVRVEGSGTALRTMPAAGASVTAGTVVRMIAAGSR